MHLHLCRLPAAALLGVACHCLPLSGLAADTVFSGPQPGERTTGFKVVELTGEQAGRERDPVAEAGAKPAAYVFVHTIERSLVPLLKVVDEYGADRKDRLRTEIVFLAADRLQGEQRVRAAAGSLKLQSRVGLSLDGAEGPGNYGLNKECMMTVVVAREDRVTANFALVQPGFADAPRVIAALAQACGDTNPPTAEALRERQMARGGGRAAGGRPAPEMEAQRGASPAKDPFPGAVPTDERLQGMLRSFIRPTNDSSAVDRVLEEVRAYIKDNDDLKRQAIDGWTRVLHFGDRYGTEYSRKVGREFLTQLQSAKP